MSYTYKSTCIRLLFTSTFLTALSFSYLPTALAFVPVGGWEDDGMTTTSKTKATASHVTQMRTAINAVRALAACGTLGPLSYAGVPPTTGGVIYASHISQMKAEISDSKYNVSNALINAIPDVSPGDMIRASHFTALRAAIEAANCTGVGTCPNGSIDAGETCDDNNVANGDGCSNACQCECTAWSDVACGPSGGCLPIDMHQTRNCPNPIAQCAASQCLANGCSACTLPSNTSMSMTCTPGFSYCGQPFTCTAIFGIADADTCCYGGSCYPCGGQSSFAWTHPVPEISSCTNPPIPDAYSGTQTLVLTNACGTVNFDYEAKYGAGCHPDPMNNAGPAPQAMPPDCGPICGNNVIEPPEQCDDGGIIPGDGCSATCLNELADCSAAFSGSSGCNGGFSNSPTFSQCVVLDHRNNADVTETYTCESAGSVYNNGKDDCCYQSCSLAGGVYMCQSNQCSNYDVGYTLNSSGFPVPFDDGNPCTDDAAGDNACPNPSGPQHTPNGSCVCSGTCGDATCNSTSPCSETANNCCQDCGSGCNDGICCVASGEDPNSCVSDCCVSSGRSVCGGGSICCNSGEICCAVMGDLCIDPGSCLGPYCGDGNVDMGEQCEPPNTPTCNGLCQNIIVCGDGNVGPGEQCDDGGMNGVCPAACSTACTVNSCSGTCYRCDAGSGMNPGTGVESQVISSGTCNDLGPGWGTDPNPPCVNCWLCGSCKTFIDPGNSCCNNGSCVQDTGVCPYSPAPPSCWSCCGNSNWSGYSQAEACNNVMTYLNTSPCGLDGTKDFCGMMPCSCSAFWFAKNACDPPP